MVLENSRSLREFLGTQKVLILLWVEYGLGEVNLLHSETKASVLILLWVEYGLGVALNLELRLQRLRCLNPSLGGIWSWRPSKAEIATQIKQS